MTGNAPLSLMSFLNNVSLSSCVHGLFYAANHWFDPILTLHDTCSYFNATTGEFSWHRWRPSSWQSLCYVQGDIPRDPGLYFLVVARGDVFHWEKLPEFGITIFLCPRMNSCVYLILNLKNTTNNHSVPSSNIHF